MRVRVDVVGVDVVEEALNFGWDFGMGRICGARCCHEKRNRWVLV